MTWRKMRGSRSENTWFTAARKSVSTRRDQYLRKYERRRLMREELQETGCAPPVRERGTLKHDAR